MTRVVGGVGALEASWPWIVSIQHPGLGHWCGGSLITADWVLTAAHCFDKLESLKARQLLDRWLGFHHCKRGSCGLRAPQPDYSSTTYSTGNEAYDYGMTRVVGGVGALEASWPWIVSIQHPGLGHWCGGSLITADWVLTAAHCFDKLDDISMLYVVLGATEFTQPGPGAVVRNVKQVVVHPYYRRADFSYDIALLQLDGSVQCSAYIQLACLADPALEVSKLDNCWIAGWGSTTARAQGSSGRLQEAKVQLINSQLCNSTAWYAGQVHPYNLCAGYPQGTIDTCQGDSGGPLMCKDNTAEYWWVVGLTSWGEGCARPKRPGIYTSTRHFYHWIDYNIRAFHTAERAS
ncbi:acrosin-like [Chamaea fasciata]|uniref:acrosin-like n=2 Tax=Chamaea fasciata TaxID=190680 RepID=UPI00336AB0DB